MQMDLEADNKTYITEQKYNQKRSDYDILQWKTAAIPRDRCIGCKSRGKSCASKGWNVVPRKWGTQ